MQPFSIFRYSPSGILQRDGNTPGITNKGTDEGSREPPCEASIRSVSGVSEANSDPETCVMRYLLIITGRTIGQQ